MYSVYLDYLINFYFYKMKKVLDLALISLLIIAVIVTWLYVARYLYFSWSNTPLPRISTWVQNSYLALITTLTGATGLFTFLSWLISGKNDPWSWAKPLRRALFWIADKNFREIVAIIILGLYVVISSQSSFLRKDHVFENLLIESAYNAEVDSLSSKASLWEGALYEGQVAILREYVQPAFVARALINMQPQEAQKIASNICDIIVDQFDDENENFKAIRLLAYMHYKSICSKDYTAIRQIFEANIEQVTLRAHPAVVARLYMDWGRWLAVWSVNTYDIYNKKPEWATDSLAIWSLDKAEAMMENNPHINQKLLCPIQWNKADVMIRHFDPDLPDESQRIVRAFENASLCYQEIRADVVMARRAKYNIAILKTYLGEEDESLKDFIDLYFDFGDFNSGMMAYALIVTSGNEVPTLGRETRLINEVRTKGHETGNNCLKVLDAYYNRKEILQNACCLLYECFLTDPPFDYQYVLRRLFTT